MLGMLMAEIVGELLGMGKNAAILTSLSPCNYRFAQQRVMAMFRAILGRLP